MTAKRELRAPVGRVRVDHFLQAEFPLLIRPTSSKRVPANFCVVVIATGFGFGFEMADKLPTA